MFARHVTVHGSPDRIDEGIRVQNEHVLPALRDCAGFKAQLFLVDRSTGEVIGISLWETENDMIASEEKVSVVRTRVADQVGASRPADVRIYELAVFEVS